MNKRLRQLIASVIADEKAYNVPSLCQRVGLEDGEESEAFISKYRYAYRRILAVSDEQAFEAGKILAKETESFELSEEIQKILERDQSPVTELTRRSVIKFFSAYGLSNEQGEFALLEKVWPISEMPPTGSSGSEASLAEEIQRHFMRFGDWELSELLEKIGLLTCSIKQLFRFIETTVNPLFADEERQDFFVVKLNEILGSDSYHLTYSRELSKRKIYTVQQVNSSPPSDQLISGALATFDKDTIHERWEAALNRRSDDPRGAITLARTLLEDVSKWILDDAEVEYSSSDDLPKLYRKLSRELNLSPDKHTEHAFKQILGSCQQIVETLGALRNKLGDAHSQGPRKARPKSRHAELAVNLSGAMATFLVATWDEQSNISTDS